jgi:hypothetical protein
MSRKFSFKTYLQIFVERLPYLFWQNMVLRLSKFELGKQKKSPKNLRAANITTKGVFPCKESL